MVNYLIIGGAQSGKTTMAKKIASSYKNSGVIDIQGNWSEYPIILENKNRFRLLPATEMTGGIDLKYLDSFIKDLKDTCFVFEETFTYISNRFPDWVNKYCCINKAYTGLRSVFIYHSFKDVNTSLLIKADYIILLKTASQDRDYCKKKSPSLLPYFDELQKRPQYTHFLVKNSDLALNNLK